MNLYEKVRAGNETKEQEDLIKPKHESFLNNPRLDSLASVASASVDSCLSVSGLQAPPSAPPAVRHRGFYIMLLLCG